MEQDAEISFYYNCFSAWPYMIRFSLHGYHGNRYIYPAEKTWQ